MIRVLQLLLSTLARLYRWRFAPRIVAVTGSVGKTTTKEAIAAVLATAYRVRASAGNLNNELGVPLTVLGDFADEYYRTGGTAWFWIRALTTGIAGLFRPGHAYPQVLVLEYGADRPGDIRRLCVSYPPDVGVITAVGDVPVHVEFYASARQVAGEKAHIIRALAERGTAVLNADDATVLDLRDQTRAQVVTFGSGQGAEVRVSDARVLTDADTPVGVTFDVEVQGAMMPVTVRGTLGRGIAHAAAAAVAVARVFDVGLAQSCEALSRMHTPPGRLRILSGIKGSIIIDDTYNASPSAMHLAIDAMQHLDGRKIMVLGDMRELGGHSVQAHQAIGTRAATVADILVCVGQGGAIMAEAASNQLPSERLFRCADSREAGTIVQRLLRAGDIVLVKASQGMRMERTVRELMAEPHRAHELLVRQSARWLAKE